MIYFFIQYGIEVIKKRKEKNVIGSKILQCIHSNKRCGVVFFCSAIFVLIFYFFLQLQFLCNFEYLTYMQDEDTVQEDASDVEQGKPYHWHDWCIVRSRDCLYLWNESCALELSNGSNGWFRFILDGKLATMYSSGSPEGGSDSSGRYSIFFHLRETKNIDHTMFFVFMSNLTLLILYFVLQMLTS